MSNWPEINLSSPDAETHALAETLGVSPFLAQLLKNRDLDAHEARLMLAEVPSLHWPEPDFTQDLQELFSKLHRENALIAIFGDYDADGLSGSSVLHSFLNEAGFAVTTQLPTRSQGYGLNPTTLQALIDEGHQLLITVDCGISNREEIAFCRAQGMEVIITDHHGLPEILPEARFILHPQVLDIEALQNLSGAGMAYWLTCLLAPAFPQAPAPETRLDLAVLGTLADMTPLRGLNFALAKRGLQAFQKTQRQGLLALCQLKNIVLETLTEDDLTFRLIPLLNAAGRIDSPKPALDLLLAPTENEAKQLATELESLNRQRQHYCQEVLQSAQAKLQGHTGQTIVLADAQWPHGVLGITCSQLLGEYHQPVVLMAIEEGGQIAKGSIRAPEGYHVLQALQQCQHLLLKFGGHEMAGGFSINTARIADFAQAFDRACQSQQGEYTHHIQVDMALNPRLLSLDLWKETRQLAPFGVGNPAPLLMSLKAPLSDVKPDKKSQTHLFAQLGSDIRVKAWGSWQAEYVRASSFDLIYRLERNRWRGKDKLELTLEHLRVSPAQPAPRAPQTSTPRETVPPPPATVRAVVPKQPARRLQSPYPAQPLTPSAYLPGFFSAGGEWWQVPEVRYTDLPEPGAHWHDMRHHSESPEYSVQYHLSCPAHAVLKTAKPGEFSGLLLGELPPQGQLEHYRHSFHNIYLTAQTSPTPLPHFTQLQQVIQWLGEPQNAGTPLRSALDLAQMMHWDRYQAKICLRALCDLGLLTYDRERYCLSYKNQAYHLENSVFYQEEKAFWQARQSAQRLWHHLSFERLKNLLIQEAFHDTDSLP